jgi:exocyst complex component 3
MADLDGATIKLAELLRHPEDLEKIPALKSEFTRKKASIDSQLKSGLKDQLEVTQSGMTSISDGQRTLTMIKEEMMKIDKLCAEAQNMIKDFPNINLVSTTHRSFTLVETMKSDLESFNDRLSEVENLLREDDMNEEEMPNLLPAHYELTQLRNIRDDAIDQISRASDNSLQSTLEEYFVRLDQTVEWFDEHIGKISLNILNIIQMGNNGLVVRLAVIIAEEEKNDKKVKALQEAQKDHQELAARFKSITTGPKQVRGYKDRFLLCIKVHAEQQFMEVEDAFKEDPEKLEKACRWFFNELNTVKLGLMTLVPKKWKILNVYGETYHQLMHDFLVRQIDDPETPPAAILSILHWQEKYHKKMDKLGFVEPELQPQLIDGREAELVREWRQLIVKYLEEWIDRIFKTDQQEFTERNPDTLERDENGLFRTRNMVDMWKMLREQTIAAGNSDRTDAVEGVVDAMIRVLKRRQQTWQNMIEDEIARLTSPTATGEGYDTIYDWLVAVTNDHIACIDDDEETGQTSYLERFKREFEPLVTPKYMIQATDEIESLRNGYVDLGTFCITKFVHLIFSIDFKSILAEFFTPKWYTEFCMKRIISTFEDYTNDYRAVLNPPLFDILVEELADELLVRYLLSVRNRGAKFKRLEPFPEKIRDDVVTVFEFFGNFQDFGTIKQKWRVMEGFINLLTTEKGLVPDAYVEFKMEYWDLQLSWVESVIRSRDDFDRSMLNTVKARAAEVEVVRGPETLMSKIK